MNKIVVLFFTFLFIASCASMNPYNVSEGEGAYLKNREEYRGKAKFIYTFSSAVKAEEKKIFDDRDFWSGKYATNKIPSGEISLGILIYYYPEGSYNDLSMSEKLKLGAGSKEALTLGSIADTNSRFHRLRNPYKIGVVNPKEKISGFPSIKINALEGNTYQINCKIEDGKAYIWIEDDSGKRVSDVVRGIGERYPKYWLWETLPDPKQ